MFAELSDCFESQLLPFICPHSQRAHSYNSPHSFGEEEVSVTLDVCLRVCVCVFVWEGSPRRSTVTTGGPGHALLKRANRQKTSCRRRVRTKTYVVHWSRDYTFWEREGPSGMSVRGDAAAAAATLQGPSGRPRPSLWLFYLLPIDGVDLTSRFVKPRRIDGGLLYRSARSCSVLCVSPSLHKQRSVRGQKEIC